MHATDGLRDPVREDVAGLATCELDTLHLDIETGRPANPQLAMYTPDKVSEGFAWYKVHQELHGLPIVGFLVPASTFEVHALFVDTPIANARRLTHNAYGSEFSDERLHDEGMAPVAARPQQSQALHHRLHPG